MTSKKPNIEAELSAPVARKEHRCIWCSQSILKGEKHDHYRGMWDGEWQDWRMHIECHHEYAEGDYGEIDAFGHDRPVRKTQGSRITKD